MNDSCVLHMARKMDYHFMTLDSSQNQLSIATRRVKRSQQAASPSL